MEKPLANAVVLLKRYWHVFASSLCCDQAFWIPYEALLCRDIIPWEQWTWWLLGHASLWSGTRGLEKQVGGKQGWVGGLENTPITWMRVQTVLVSPLVSLASGQLLVTGICWYSFCQTDCLLLLTLPLAS